LPVAQAPAARSIRKPKGGGHERRAEILSAAERIFVEHGYEGATIRKIADEVGLSSTALYMHFADKAEILHEICREAFEALTAANAAVIAEPAPPVARLRKMMQAYVDFGFANPNAYRLIYLTRPLEARDGAQTAAQEVGAGLFRAFEDVVREAEVAGQLKRGARETAQALWAGGHGVVSLMITKPYFDWTSREALTAAVLDGLFDGLFRP
jgi:AcrR family transcriptional regulator